MLIWTTGEENAWNVEINKSFSQIKGYREILSYIRVDSQKLYLINYESLTMGAQFSDIQLPEEHMKDLLIELENGVYAVRVVQFYNPDTGTYVSRRDIDFLIEFQITNELKNVWTHIPWLNR